MVAAIGMVGKQNCLTDEEMVDGKKSVLAYLESNLKPLRKRRGKCDR